MSAPKRFRVVEFQRHGGARPDFVVYGPDGQLAICLCEDTALRLARALNADPSAFAAALPDDEENPFR